MLNLRQVFGHAYLVPRKGFTRYDLKTGTCTLVKVAAGKHIENPETVLAFNVYGVACVQLHVVEGYDLVKGPQYYADVLNRPSIKNTKVHHSREPTGNDTAMREANGVKACKGDGVLV